MNNPPFKAVGWYADELPYLGSHIVFRVMQRSGRIIDLTPGEDLNSVVDSLAPARWWEKVVGYPGTSDAALDYVFCRCREAGQIAPPLSTAVVDDRRILEPEEAQR